MKVIDFHDQPLPEPADSPLVAKYSNRKSKNTLVVKQVEDLQRWLNTFPGVFVKVDGIPYEKTSDAYKLVTGIYLPDDPRG